MFSVTHAGMMPESASSATMKDQVEVCLYDEFRCENVTRRIGVLSEFWGMSEARKVEYFETWISQRGNDQHDTLLTFVSWSEISFE